MRIDDSRSGHVGDSTRAIASLVSSCSIQDNIYSDLFPTTLIFKQTLSSFQWMIFRRLVLKINTFNKLLAERSLDSHILWKGALRWAWNSVKKLFIWMITTAVNNDYISVSDPGKGPGRPRPPYLRVRMTRPPLSQDLDLAFSVGWRKGERKWPANYWKTLARRKGKDEWCAQNRRTLAEREAAFPILAQVFSFSFLYISTEPAPQAYPLWNVSVEKRHMPVHTWFFPSKCINKQPTQTKLQDLLVVYGRTYLMRHISLVRTSRTWLTLCLYTENFRGHFFNNRNILVMKSEKLTTSENRSKNNGNLCISWMNRIVIQKTVLAVVEL